MHAAEARAAKAVDLHFADGRVAASVGDAFAVSPRSARTKVEPRGPKPYPPAQPTLFDPEE